MNKKAWYLQWYVWTAVAVIIASVVFWGVLFQQAGKAKDSTATAAKTPPSIENTAGTNSLPTAAHEKAVRDLIGQTFGDFTYFIAEGDTDGYIDLPTGMSALLVRVKNKSETPMQIDALDDKGHIIERVVDKGPMYWGTTMLDEHVWQATTLKVSAAGPWRVKILPIADARLMKPTVTRGTGDTIVLYDTDTRSLLVNYFGSGDFDIRMVNNETGRVLAQSHGPFSDVVTPIKGPAAMIVHCEGKWSISKQK